MTRHSLLGLTALSIFLFQILFASGHIYSYDELALLDTAASLVDEQDASLSNHPFVLLYGKVGRDGKRYSQFGIGMSAFLVPFYAAGKVAGILLGAADPRVVADIIASFANSAVIPLVALVFFLALRAFKIDPRSACATTLLLTYATTLAVYGRGLFSDALAGLLVLASYRFFIAGQFACSGAAVAALAATRQEYALMVGVFALFIGFKKPLIRFLAVPVAVGVLLGLYNFARFGSPANQGQFGANEYETFSTPLPVGLFGLFLSPGKGLLWYSPPIILALMGLREFFAPQSGAPECGGRRRDAWLAIALCAPLIILHACWHSWMGGWSYGPRRLVALLPLMMLPAGFAVRRLMKKPGGDAALWAFGIVGFAVQIGGLTTNFMSYIKSCPSFHATLWTIEYSSALGQLRMLTDSGNWDLWYFHLFGVTPAALVTAGVIGIAWLGSMLALKGTCDRLSGLEQTTAPSSS